MREFKTHTHISSNWLLRKLNFGFCVANHFFFPDTWSTQRIKVAKVHEMRHAIQQCQLGFGIHPWVGMLPFMLLYFLVFLPLGLAFFRMFFEYQSDRDEVTYLVETGRITNTGVLKYYIDESAKTVSGYHYFFPCPLFITKLFYNRIFNDLRLKMKT